MQPPPTRLAIGFGLGFVFMPLFDAIHVAGGALVYTNPTVWRTAWWVAPQFGLLTAFIVLLMTHLEPRVGPPHGLNISAETLVGETLLFSAIYCSTVVFADHSAALATVLLALAGARLVFRGARGDALYVAACAVLGPMGEMNVSATGGFAYLQPDIGWGSGVPYWLFGQWAHVGFFARRVLYPVAFWGR